MLIVITLIFINLIVINLIVIMHDCNYADCHDAECHYTDFYYTDCQMHRYDAYMSPLTKEWSYEIVGSFVRNFRNKLKSVCPWQAFPAYSNKHSGLAYYENS